MRIFIAVATNKDRKGLWKGHFGMAPVYSIFDDDGILIEQVDNPYANEGRHHDDPVRIAELLDDVYLFIGSDMGRHSRKLLTEKLGVKSLLLGVGDIYQAVEYFLEAKKNIDVFERCIKKYEDWFEKYKYVYESELNMIKSILPPFERAIEVGVGSGRFAAPLGIKEGVEPSEKMAELARERGIKVYPGFAENLPVMSGMYDLVLIAVTICFVKDPLETLREAYRILRDKGNIVLAIVDRETPIGKGYLNKKEKGKFYKNANFFSTPEIHSMLRKVGFKIKATYQTLFSNSIRDINEIQPFKDGFSEGGFVAVLGSKRAGNN